MEREGREMIARKQGSGGAAVSPCAACKLLRRRCVQDCIFAPYFPADEPQKFATVHKVFGASNVSKLLQELSTVQRSDAVSSLVYEANARVRDPVYGCVASISSLQRQINLLHAQLALAQAEIVHLHLQHAALFACTSSVAMAPLCSDATASANTSQSVIDTGNINEKSIFSIDMLLDHANIGLPMWSC
ncbi:hypothetical protein M5K25_014846 [Dendrobium thyrsiflorum]|uniref:LOB domain-containing protein n=1 Tax=Dendrobium thyrsiflorum TaxID=117978 RepID=A0ABD0UVM0_DENTH